LNEKQNPIVIETSQFGISIVIVETFEAKNVSLSNHFNEKGQKFEKLQPNRK
jgi:hypothetical protein